MELTVNILKNKESNYKITKIEELKVYFSLIINLVIIYSQLDKVLHTHSITLSMLFTLIVVLTLKLCTN